MQYARLLSINNHPFSPNVHIILINSLTKACVSIHPCALSLFLRLLFYLSYYSFFLSAVFPQTQRVVSAQPFTTISTANRFLYSISNAQLYIYSHKNCSHFMYVQKISLRTFIVISHIDRLGFSLLFVDGWMDNNNFPLQSPKNEIGSKQGYGSTRVRRRRRPSFYITPLIRSSFSSKTQQQQQRTYPVKFFFCIAICSGKT